MRDNKSVGNTPRPPSAIVIDERPLRPLRVDRRAAVFRHRHTRRHHPGPESRGTDEDGLTAACRNDRKWPSRYKKARLLAAVGMKKHARHVPAARALIRDQSRFACQGGDADHFVHRSSTSCACQSTTAFASRQVRHDTGALRQGSFEVRFSMVANARCAAWLRSDGNGPASRQTGERGGRFKKGGLDRQFRRTGPEAPSSTARRDRRCRSLSAIEFLLLSPHITLQAVIFPGSPSRLLCGSWKNFRRPRTTSNG